MPVTPNEAVEPFDWITQMGEDAHLFIFAEFMFRGRRPKGSIGIAVSGGSDSLALLHIMAEAAPHFGLSLRAATVDHDLRNGSAAEAAAVARICAGLGVPHDILLWQHGEIAGNLQDQASRARYGLLADWAVQNGVSDVLIGHTADDQAETFLMGLAREAGLDGLSGMRGYWRQGEVDFHRPLLAQTRVDLRGFLARRGVAWVDDPSNDNDRFMRVKARRALRALKPLGITVERLARTIDNLANAQNGLIKATHDVWQQIGSEANGALHMPLRDLRGAGAEVQRRLLLAAIKWISGADYAPRAHKFTNLEMALGQDRDATLGGCRFRVEDKQLTILREARSLAGVSCPTTDLWDNRWQISGPHGPDLTIRALGAEGLRAVKDWRLSGISREALIVSPGIWRNSTLIAAPIAGFPNGWAAKPHRSFASFILSH